MSAATQTREILLLRGSSLLHAETLQTIATLGEDGLWRAPDGAVTDAIGVPHQAATAIVKPAEQQAADRAQDAAWIEQALKVAREVASQRRDITVDDIRMALSTKPRKPSLMSTLMVAAARQGLIEKTSAHRPSIRTVNGGRAVRVWKSLIHDAQGTGR
jgi:hypothetical protein